MTKQKYQSYMAVKEHMLDKNKLTRLEAIILFGESNLPEKIRLLKKDGYIIKSQNTLMIKILQRLSKYAICNPPKNLPVKEIQMIEYWIST